MAITTLDPKTALLVIDLQKGIVTYPTVHPIDEIVRHASALAEAFRRHVLPVVLVNVTGGAPGRTEQSRQRGEPAADWADLIPESRMNGNGRPSRPLTCAEMVGAHGRPDALEPGPPSGRRRSEGSLSPRLKRLRLLETA